jgi:ABC-type glycerol-3-phosphate transport system substrate-binding protein
MNKSRAYRYFAASIALAVIVALGLSGMAVAQEGELTVSYMQSGTYDKAAEELAPRFEEETGIKVSIVAFPWADLRQNNTTDLLTGTGAYDVMSGGYYLADVYDYFEPLTQYIADSNYAEGMIPGLMDPGRSEWSKGEQIGIPYGIDAYGLMVNNELLAQAGVEPSFATWDDVLAACEVIAEKLPDIACFSHSTGNPEQIGAFFFSGYDGTFISKDGAFALETDKAVAAAAILPELWKYLPPNGMALTFDESEQIFIDGNAAMLITWPSFASTKLDDPANGLAGKWSQVPFPGAGFPWLSLWQMFIPKTTENKDAAFKWIQAFAGEANAKDWYVKYGIGSVWLSTYEDEELAAQHAHQWPSLVADYGRAKNPPLSGEAQDFLTNTLVEIATGQKTPEEGIGAVNEKWLTIPVPPSILEVAAAAGFQAQ